jgi:hypothetical protein
MRCSCVFGAKCRNWLDVDEVHYALAVALKRVNPLIDTRHFGVQRI